MENGVNFNEGFCEMDSENTTTRKGFLRNAGMAIAGMFALSGGAGGAGRRAAEDGRAARNRRGGPELPRAARRLRQARGTVERGSAL